jgi:hypothetical protein
VDVDLAEVGLAKLLARGADDVQPVTASGERSADGGIEDSSPSRSERRVPQRHRVPCCRALQLRGLGQLVRLARTAFHFHSI